MSEVLLSDSAIRAVLTTDWNTYDLGDEVTMTASFVDKTESVVPDDVEVEVARDDGTVLDPQIMTLQGADEFVYRYTPDAPGWHTWRVLTIGGVQAAGTRRFRVRPVPFTARPGPELVLDGGTADSVETSAVDGGSSFANPFDTSTVDGGRPR